MGQRISFPSTRHLRLFLYLNQWEKISNLVKVFLNVKLEFVCQVKGDLGFVSK